VREAHRTLYRRGLPFRKAVSQLAESVKTRTGKMILDFVQVESDRGYCGSQPRVRHLKSAQD